MITTIIIMMQVYCCLACNETAIQQFHYAIEQEDKTKCTVNNFPLNNYITCTFMCIVTVVVVILLILFSCRVDMKQDVAVAGLSSIVSIVHVIIFFIIMIIL